MIIRIIMLLLIVIGSFCGGYYFGINKKGSDSKIYDIKFELLSTNGTVIKSSVLINRIVNFCDTVGISILNIKIDGYLNTLKVKCTKDQYFLLIQELTKNENRIELTNISF